MGARLAWVGHLWLVAASARAQPLTYDDALTQAADAPDVRAATAAHEVRTTRDRRIQGVGANPQLSLQPGWRTRPDADSGFELQATVTQQLSVAGLGRARREAAAAERRTLSVEIERRLLRRRLAVAAAWVDLWRAEQALELVAPRREVLERRGRAVARGIELGSTTVLDADRVEATRAELAAREATLRREHRIAQIALATALAMSSSDLETRGAPPSTTPSESDVVAVLESLPEVRAATAAIDVLRRRETEVRAENGTRVSVGAQLLVEQPGGLVTYGILSITPPIAERGDRELAQVRGALEGAEVEADGTRRRVERRARAALATMRALEAEVEVLDSQTLPRLEALLERHERRRELGAALIFEELTVAERILDLRGRLLDARAAERTLALHLQLLVASSQEIGR